MIETIFFAGKQNRKQIQINQNNVNNGDNKKK